MAITLNEYRDELIDKILFAETQDEVKQLIDTVMKTMEQHAVNGIITERFLNKMSGRLQTFNPMNENAQQWSNITTAKVELNRIKHRNQLKAC
ncbi:MAG: hypothetical protein WAR78_08755 [Ferruginibacter sp.]